MQTFRTDLKVGESLSIDGGRVTVTLEEKSGQRARLSFNADEDVTFSKPRAATSSAKHARMGIGMKQVA